MKCQEVDRLLDSQDREPLSRSQQLAVDQHLASCPVCREAWAACRQLTAEHVPHAPAGLWLRIAAALPARSATQARWGRSLAVGGLLLAGAAVAATVAWRLTERAPEATSAAESLPSVAPAPNAERAPSAVSPAESGAAARVEDAARVEGAAAANGAASSADDYAVDPHSIAVIVRGDAAAAPQAAAAAASCHAEIVRQLQAVNGLTLVAPERVAPFLATNLSEEEIARRLGAGSALILSGENGCNARQIDARTRAPLSGLMYGGGPARPDSWQPFATRVAVAVRDATLKDSGTLLAEARATLLNTALEDRERISALWTLRMRQFPQPPVVEADVIAAVVQIGATSRDAGARQAAWGFLRTTDDPSMVQPLLAALARDPVPDVRMAAAFALHNFVDDPLVRDALARAAAEDPDAEPRVPCCIPTVRESARRALLSDEDLRASIVAAARDETLPPRARLRELTGSVDGRGLGFPLDDETAQAVLDIGRLADDPMVRAQAWDTLSRASPSPEASRALLDDFTSHSDDEVRAAAARGLRRYADDPAVRAALERAEADASPDVRSAARRALGR